MQNTRFTSLRLTIIAAGTAFALILLGLIAFDRWREHEEVLAGATHDSTLAALALAEHTDQMFTAVDLLMEHIAGEVNVHPFLLTRREAELHRRLQYTAASAPFIDTIAIYDSSGRPVVSSDSSRTRQSIAEMDFFAAHRDDPGK